MSFEDLRDRLDAQGLLPTRDTLSAAVVRRLACDAEIIPASARRSSRGTRTISDQARRSSSATTKLAKS